MERTLKNPYCFTDNQYFPWLLRNYFSMLIKADGMTHCLKKHERLLHSEVTSKTQVQATLFAKCPALFMAGHFVLYKILLPDSIGHIGF